MENKIKEKILPFYRSLLDGNKSLDTCTFAPQWGKNFPFKEKNGILFIGKAVNGWIKNEQDVNKLFDLENDNRIFARKDQMEWVNESAGNTKGYNTNKSAFWRVIRAVSEKYYPQDWQSNVAWSNLYKIAPWKGGNPTSKQIKNQFELCAELLKSEIEIFSPEYVVMLTSDWEKSFLEYLNNQNKFENVQHVEWDKYSTRLVEINGTKFILSVHPQGKPEILHKEAILKLMS